MRHGSHPCLFYFAVVGREISILKKKLTNLSAANPLLWMGRTRAGIHLDVARILFESVTQSEDFLNQLCSGKKKIRLGPVYNPRSPAENRVGEWLNRLSKFRHTEIQERGTDHLFLGWPFVQGQWPDGSPLRTPFQLIPVNLFSDGKDWWLEPRLQETVINPAFLLAYARHCGKPLEDKFYEKQLEMDAEDARHYLTQLYELLKESLLDLNFNSDLFSLRIQEFATIRKTDFSLAGKAGLLKLQPNAVLGLFPLSDSVLLPDFDRLEKSGLCLEDLFCKELPQIATPDERQFLFPLPVDGSQEACLREVLSGKHLLIQGPPGSGKSQLITNLAASAAAAGKSVLIVCQKRVALEVVHKRLEFLGIGRHVAMWADFRNDVSRLYGSIARQIDELEETESRNKGLDTVMLEREFHRCCLEISRVSDELEEWKRAVFDESHSGISSLQIKEMLSGPANGIPFPGLLAFSYDDWEDFLRWLSRYENEIRQGRPAQTLLAARGKWPSESLNSIFAELKEILGWEAQLSAFLENYLANTGSEKQAFQEMDACGKAFPSVNEVLKKEPAKRIFAPEFLHNLTEKAEELRHLLKKLESWPDSLNAAEGELDLVLSLQNEVDNNQLNWLSLRSVFSSGLRPLVRWHRELKKAGFVQPGMVIREAARMRELGLEDALFKGVSPFARGRQMAELHLNQLPEIQEDLMLQGEFFRIILKFFPQLAEGSLEELNGWVRRILSLIQTQKIVDEKLEYYFPFISSDQRLAGLKQEYYRMQTLLPEIRKADSLLESTPLHWQEALLFFFAPDNSLRYEDLNLAWANAWNSEMEERMPILRAGNAWFQNEIRILKEAIEKKQKLAGDIIRLKLEEETHRNLERNRLQNRVTYRGLYHQVTRKRQRLPLRRLWQSFGDEILRLVPCWLATPESVSATWELDMQFDLVIFDEASQCFAEKGIPAVARGRQVLVIGDDKQLPPNHLFSARWEEEEASQEEAPFAEQESLLDLARQFFPSCMLTGHYRSRFPELIEFSNTHFYEGKLQMLPPPETLFPRKSSLRFIQVEGRWENQCNPAEAQRIAAEAIRFFKENSETTLGVVCFNARQQERIEEELLKASIQAGIMIPDWFFVKNIENVQGDERDFIWFSLAYAVNNSGAFNTQFGSLSQQGGENRLNVAITRARLGVTIFSSLSPEEWQFASRLAKGPAMLAAYIQFVSKSAAESSDENRFSEGALAQLADDWETKNNRLIFNDFKRVYRSDSMKAHFGLTPVMLEHAGYKVDFQYWTE